MLAVLRRFGGLGPRERAAAFAAAAVLVGIVTFAGLLGRDTRVALFATPLRSEQLAEVVDRLAEWNVAFVAGTDNVRIDASRRNEVLLKLALAGVPHAHLESSAEALARAGPLTPQSVLDAQALAGLEGDIASGLRSLAGVDDAQVLIAPARESAFADEPGAAATASVRLALRPGVTVPAATLAGVRAFVAAAVPGLDAARVAVLDDRGFAIGSGAAPLSDEAQGLQQSLQSALDAALGAASTVVRVRVSYDPRLRQVHDVVRRPVTGRAIGETTTGEHFKSASKQYEKASATLDRGSVVEDERIDVPAGRLERISVAIAVDNARGFDLTKIRALATATLGLVSGRDQLTVEAVAFPRESLPAVRTPFAAVIGLIAALAPALIGAIVVVVLLRVAGKPFAAVCEIVATRLAVRQTSRAVAAFAPAQVRGALRDEPPHTAAAIISALPAATATAVLELYAPEERAAIVRRMARAAAPAVPDYETIVRRG